LKEEIAVLKEQLEHNPQITKYAVENQNLRREIKRLRTQETVVSSTRYEEQRIKELEKAYQDLMAENQATDGKILSILLFWLQKIFWVDGVKFFIK
jgi:cell shape-determining protein MreC